MFYFLLVFLFFFERLSTQCTVDNSSFLNTTVTLPTLSPTNEIINGVNYGNLYAIPNGLWMLMHFNISQSVTEITTSCPLGWVPPTLDDLNNLLSFAGSNLSILTNRTTFNMNSSIYYASNTKCAPTNTNGSTDEAWEFYAIKFNSTSAYIGNASSYFDTAITQVLCVHSAKSINNTLISASALNVTGLSEKDLIKGIKYTFSVNNTNMIGYLWNLAGQTNSSQDLNVIPMKYGQEVINVKASLFDGTTIGYCLNVWVRNYTGSEANTTLNASSINHVQFNDTNVYRSTSLHFTSGSAPIAPIDTGGAYILYANSANNNSLSVKTIDNNGNQISEMNLGTQGYPFDVVAIPCGFSCLIMDFTARDTLTLFGWDTCTNQKLFQRIIMNNGYQPNVSNSDQLIFYSSSNGSAMFGMDAMYEPSSGRLTFGKGRIVTIFAHYNHFGFNADGSRNDHTGDTLVSFNMTGQNEKLAWSWGCSHSLSESLVYNGEKAFSISLGDAYPQNILFANAEILLSNSQADPKTGLYNRLDSSTNSSLLPDYIPGNGGGQSCGRMGIISVFNDGNLNFASYARRKCSATFDGTTTSSVIDEMGVAIYDNLLNKTGDINLGSGAYTNQIQSVKYGNNLFVAYVTTNQTNGNFLIDTISSSDLMTYMLINLNGQTISGPFNMNSSILPPSDDLRILSDGRVAWTYVDANYTLNYYYLTMPDQTPTNEALVLASPYYKNNSDFYFIDNSDTNSYKTSSSGTATATATTNTTNTGGGSKGSFQSKIDFPKICGFIASMIFVSLWG